jgi:tetratricopeptide (TPR) repeat protein
MRGGGGAQVLCDYIIYQLHNPRKGLELCSLATTACDYKDWWWKARLGKCYYQLGLQREAAEQFASVLRSDDMIVAVLELCKVYIKQDQPNKALEVYRGFAARHPGDLHSLIGIARLYDQLNDIEQSVTIYRQVLEFDASNVEAISCLASNYFYTDQPELALRLYRRCAARHARHPHAAQQQRVFLPSFPRADPVLSRACAASRRAPAKCSDFTMHAFALDAPPTAPPIALPASCSLLQMGLHTAELWNNLGLCCFYASQYDMCLVCYERALALAVRFCCVRAHMCVLGQQPSSLDPYPVQPHDPTGALAPKQRSDSAATCSDAPNHRP